MSVDWWLKICDPKQVCFVPGKVLILLTLKTSVFTSSFPHRVKADLAMVFVEFLVQ